MTSAEAYVAGAYAVLVIALLLYVALIALKLARFEREVAELEALARRRVDVERRDRLEEARHG